MKNENLKKFSVAVAATALIFSASAAQGVPLETTSIKNSIVSEKTAGTALFNYDSFESLNVLSSEMGKELGPGITEKLSPESLVEINDVFSQYGLSEIPSSVIALRHLDTGDILALDKSGNIVTTYESLSLSASDISTLSVASGFNKSYTPQGILHPEVKRIIGACLGIGIAGGISAETIVQMFNTPEKAAKFVIRRLGVFGAISCAGGIIWEYI